MGFTCTAQQSGQQILVNLTGDVDLAAYPALEAEADTWAHKGVDVVVDCSKVTFMDSMGLRFLLEVQQAATEAGHNFALANPSKPVMRVLELGRRTELFQLHSGRTQPGHVTSQRDCRRRIPAVVPAGCRDRLGEHGH